MAQGLTGVQSAPAHDRERSTDGTQSSQRAGDGQNAHGELNLEEQNGGPLPTDGAKLDAIDVRLEHLPCLSHLAEVLQPIVRDRLRRGQDVGDDRGGFLCRCWIIHGCCM